MGVLVEHVSKSFPGTRALDDVSIEVPDATVHALVGANGSGKSTLVKVLTGVYQPDSGSFNIGGRRYDALSSPAQAAQLGIRVVHQEAPLTDTFSVAECIAEFHGYPTTRLGRIRWRAVTDYAREVLARFEIPVDPSELCARLRPAQRAMVSMAIALGASPETASLLVLDEATAAIPEDEADPYLKVVRGVAQSGVPVLMVTHRIREVPEIADRVTVLADGAVVHSGPAANVDEETIISLMVSVRRAAATTAPSPLPDGGRRETPVPDLAGLWKSRAKRETGGRTQAALEVDHLTTGVLKEVSFAVAKGEIVGIAGLPDSGIADLPLAVAGALAVSTGTIRVGGRELPRGCTPADAIAAGVGLVPSDRLRQGVIPTLSIRENLILPQVGRFWRRGRDERERVRSAIRTLGVRPSEPTALMGQLSGGNQQKVVIGRWLLMGPDLLVLDDPTYGVDPAARQSVFEIMRESARQGLGILFLSTEPEQLVLVCSRILVFRGGSVIKVLQEAEMTRENVARWSSL